MIQNLATQDQVSKITDDISNLNDTITKTRTLKQKKTGAIALTATSNAIGGYFGSTTFSSVGVDYNNVLSVRAYGSKGYPSIAMWNDNDITISSNANSAYAIITYFE